MKNQETNSTQQQFSQHPKREQQPINQETKITKHNQENVQCIQRNTSEKNKN